MTFLKYKNEALFAILVFSFFLFSQFGLGSSGFADPDGFYHAGAARLIEQGRMTDQFPWAYFTTLRDQYADQHYLYHILMIPLQSIAGMHLSIVLFSAAAVLAFAYLLRRLGVAGSGWWAIFLLVCSTDFLFRVNLVKANTLSLVLLFAAILLLDKQRYWWLLPLSAVFVWVYGGFVFLPVMVLIYAGAAWLLDKKLVWQPVVAVLAGIALGMVVHPHFPNIAVHLYYQIFKTGLAAGIKVPVGGEWAPYNLTDFLAINGMMFLVFIAVSGFFLLDLSEVRKKYKNPRLAISLWVMALFFLLMTGRSKRWIEYSAPFAVLFAAYAANSVVTKKVRTWLKQALLATWHSKGFSVTIAWLVALVMIYNVVKVWGYLGNTPAPDQFRSAAQWLQDHSQPGAIVLNTKWDGLPQLFYWNDHNYYIVGLDPTFMHVYSPGLYDKWRSLADNDVAKFGTVEQAYATMTRDFGAQYLFMENSRDNHTIAFLDNNAHKGLFVKVYSDSAATVYEVR